MSAVSMWAGNVVVDDAAHLQRASRDEAHVVDTARLGRDVAVVVVAFVFDWFLYACCSRQAAALVVYRYMGMVHTGARYDDTDLRPCRRLAPSRSGQPSYHPSNTPHPSSRTIARQVATKPS